MSATITLKEAQAFFQRAANHRPMWDFDPDMHAYATGPDLDRLIARAHGDPARTEDILR